MRSRNVEIILYDYKLLKKKLDLLDDRIEYAYICHDRDFEDDEKTLKKIHYHLRLFSENQKTISAWATYLGVKDNDIQILENKKRAIRYLIHYDSPKKTQYNIDEVVHNIKDIDNYFDDNKLQEEQQLKYIFDYIDTISGYIYFKEIKSYVLQNNYWSAYRRYYQIIKDIIMEHNRYTIDYMLK